MSNTLTSRYRADRTRSTLDELTNGKTFVAVGQHITDGSDSEAATAVDSDLETQQVYTNMIAGSKLTVNDVVVMIDRQTWSTGTVYQQYSRGQKTKAFVCVEQGSTKYVYKCLNNDNGSQSTEIPTGTDTQPFETSDGYVWQYMFAVDENKFTQFATDTFIPFVEDTAVTQAAVGGTIDSITITDPGFGYTNQLQGTFRVEDVNAGNSTSYKLDATGSSTDDFYNGCMIEVITPSSPAFGQMIRIDDYDGTTRVATLNTGFTNTPEIGDVYQVSPAISFITNSTPNVEAKARAIIVNESVESIVFADRGSGYRDTSAVVETHSSVGAASAVIEPNTSPSKGHGADIVAETSRRAVCIEKEINFADLSIEQTNDVRTVSLVFDPQFDNVQVTLSSGNPERFEIGETIKQFKTKGALTGNTVFTSPSTLTANTAQLSAGDTVLITAGTQTLMVEVSSVANTSTATATAAFAGTFEGEGQHIELTAEAVVDSIDGSNLITNNTSSVFNATDNIYGLTSRSADVPTAIDIDGRTSLASFNQLTRLTGALASGTLQEDETVVAADGTSAIVFSVNDLEDVVSVTNIVGQLSNQQYVGQTSGAIFTVSNVVKGDTSVDSGEILFVNNTTPISITSNKKITTKLVIEF